MNPPTTKLVPLAVCFLLWQKHTLSMQTHLQLDKGDGVLDLYTLPFQFIPLYSFLIFFFSVKAQGLILVFNGALYFFLFFN